MNREDKRKLTKMAQKKAGLSREIARAYAEVVYNADAIRLNGTGEHTPSKEFDDGESVQIDIDAIKSRQNYERMAKPYKQFIEDSAGKTYTVHIEENKLISLTEAPQWLFWSGDLLHLNEVKE